MWFISLLGSTKKRQTQMILLNRLSSLILGNLEKFFCWWGGVVTRWYSQMVLMFWTQRVTIPASSPNFNWIHTTILYIYECMNSSINVKMAICCNRNLCCSHWPCCYWLPKIQVRKYTSSKCITDQNNLFMGQSGKQS